LTTIYNLLPQETLIASTLDPRFKSLSHIPVDEHEEAWACLKAEFFSPTFFKASSEAQSKPHITTETKKRKRIDDMLSLVWEETPNTNQISNFQMNEFERYKALPQEKSNVDVMEWWKQHATAFPVISEIAKVYLSIPASQATCERSFSTSSSICTEERASLSPSHVEKLTVLKQNNKSLCNGEQ